MADRVEVFDCLIPAGTPKAAPVTRAMPFPAGYLTRLEVVIPDGVAGLAGFQIGYGGQVLIPNTVGAWIIGNDEKWADTPEFALVGDRWQLIGYNTDINDHTFHARCYVTEIGDAGAGAPVGGQVLPLAITSETPLDLTPAVPILPGAPDVPLTIGADAPVPFDLAGTDTTPLDTGTAPPPDLTVDAPPVVDPSLGGAPDVGAP